MFLTFSLQRAFEANNFVGYGGTVTLNIVKANALC